MEELARLVRLVHSYNTRSSPLINFQDESNLDTKLFSLLKTGEVKSDEEAALKLYGKKKLPASFRMLKSRLKKKLINHLHFLELPETKFSATTIIKVQCASLLSEAESLRAIHEPKLAEKSLNQALKLAKENEVNDYIVIILEQKQWINQMLWDRKNFDEQKGELEYYYNLERAEREATRIFQEQMILVKTSFELRPQIINDVVRQVQKLEDLWKETKSSKIFYYYHFLSIQSEELKGNYHAVSELIERAEKYLEEKLIHPNWFNYRFNSFARSYALLQTKQYELGLKLAEKYLPYFDAGSMNWFAFMENYLLMAIHSQNYSLFYQKFIMVFECNTIQKLPVGQLERWELFRQYGLLLMKYRLNESEITYSSQLSPSLSFLPKEKEGLNVAIVIIDVIEQISDPFFDNHEMIIGRLRKYISKYLRGENTERARLFLRLLILVFKEDFNRQDIKAKGEKFFTSLQATPLPGDAFADVEIIPYEHLWELVFDIIEERNKALA